MTRAAEMTAEAIDAELRELDAKWEAFRANLDGMSGSPGEWIIERMDELETEQRRRGLPVTPQ